MILLSTILKFSALIKTCLMKPLAKGKSANLKYFLLYNVIILKWNTSVISSNPHLMSGMSDVPSKHSYLHRF